MRHAELTELLVRWYHHQKSVKDITQTAYTQHLLSNPHLLKGLADDYMRLYKQAIYKLKGQVPELTLVAKENTVVIPAMQICSDIECIGLHGVYVTRQIHSSITKNKSRLSTHCFVINNFLFTDEHMEAIALILKWLRHNDSFPVCVVNTFYDRTKLHQLIQSQAAHIDKYHFGNLEVVGTASID
jgi:hypothetical protein